ncbi:MAG TPA: SDR family oxidoreductase [Candidatus Binatia bacterium]|jgi:2-hydroxycyclohexanecarboxyl-CoA dehydrogenase|nr:SDR family oxidoreductase [Candidatus Binatia bacterium]
MAQANEHEGRVAVVTGGSGGIGGAITQQLSNAGAIVHVIDVKSSTPPGTSFHHVDVGNETEVDAAFDVIGTTAGKIDYLVCCAGIYQPRPFLELSLEDWQRTMQINLTSYFLCCRAALRFMRPQKFGRIVMFSSMAARTGGPHVAHYAASKGGILGLARALAVESAAENIRVNIISPVITDTPMPRAVSSDEVMQSRRARIPLGRIGDVQDMTDACMFLLGDESSYVLGQDLRVNGGSTLW